MYDGFDYRAFWRDPGRRHLDRLEHGVVAELLPARGRRIVDVGCGFGRLTDAYVDRFEEVVLVDAAWSLLEQARDRWARFGVTLVAADIRALPFSPSAFDAAVMVRVLHHMEDPVDGLLAVRPILVAGGRLVANASNRRNAARIARYAVLGRGPSPFGRGVVRYGPLSFGWHPKDFEDMLEASGLRPLAWRGVGVLDKVVARWPRLASTVPPGAALARSFGHVRVAPSLFCSAVKEGGEDARVEDPFACPRCRGPLGRTPAGRACARCRRAFPERDGILDLRVSRFRQE